MYGQPSRFRPSGGGRGRGAPPPAHSPAPPMNSNYLQNPNVYLQNHTLPAPLNQYLQNPTFSIQNPNSPIHNLNFPIRNPNFPHQQLPNHVFHSQPTRPNEALERIDGAVLKAHRDLLTAGESVSSWKVSQSALLILQSDSWDSLGFQMQQVPSLHRLIVTEGKINAFIHCFVGVRRITSLYDLEVAICKSEGIERFEELELGPLVKHPLVVHYFSMCSDMTDAFKITSEEIISFLCDFMDVHKGKEIKAEELLDFIAKKRSITGREKLSVRIQSLGMHITYIRQATRSENATLKECLNGLKQKTGRKTKKRPLLTSHKKMLDDRFSAISQRIKSFSTVHGDFGGKHIKFISSSSEDDDSDDYEHEDKKDEKNAPSHSRFSSQNTNSCDQVSSCPYPSATEEMARLGLKGETDGNYCPASGTLRYNDSNKPSKKKRKSEHVSFNVPEPHKLPKRDKVEPHLLDNNELEEFSNQNEADLSLANDAIRMFITTWKEACREHNVASVFERMLLFYKTTARQRKRMKLMFSAYPCIGLLNIAVTSIKSGLWDSMYDTFQAFSQHGVVNTFSEKCAGNESIEVEPSEKNKCAGNESIEVEPSGKNKCAGNESIDVEPSEKNALIVTENVLKCKQSVTVEDIIKDICAYFVPDHDIPNNVESSLEKKINILRKLCKCEFWLTQQFSVKEFESLGYGEFLMFLEKHASLLPNALQKCLIGDTCGKSPLEVCMLQHQLAALLSQASSSLWENENITKQKISVLLMRQFPSVCFRLVESCSTKDFLDIVKENKGNAISSCVLFSATLLGMHCVGDSLAHNEKDLSKIAEVGTDIGHKAGIIGSVTTKDAIEVLLRAPMLSDLDYWSHWDLTFSPSLGPLVGWLLNEVNTKELLCLVTKDGKVLRIDHSATVDSFLEASLQGSPYQSAVELLSLFSLYGGERQVPLSLLKCHARQAFEVIMKNSMEMEVNDGYNVFSNDLHKNKSRVNKAVPVASRFILDCLGYLPVEFRHFAADVLLSGLRSVFKDAPLAILNECKKTEDRLIVHKAGLSLGVVEWIDDYHVFCSSMATDLALASGALNIKAVSSELTTSSVYMQDALDKFHPEVEVTVSAAADQQNENCTGVSLMVDNLEVSGDSFGFGNDHVQILSELDNSEAALVIESIRREEFGLDPSLSDLEGNILKKQHARLGRALYCLSQELYSQDSHFLLELVQNADDNVYQENVEPTLTFILQEAGIIVLNNEQGFSAHNIRALCDVGNSTKKGSSAGYIGKKGIGFKSVFRVTDAPEIHSNGFHVKFDVSEGQIGFVLPTITPPCDIDLFGRLASFDSDQTDTNCWNTCIVLPFRSKLAEGSAMNSIISLFSDLHPSLLLFLHRLQCIKFRNMLDGSSIVMRKEIVGDGIIKVSLGKEKMTWFVASQKLQADVIRPDVQTTEISVAFTLQESDNGAYIPHLDQQPVFSFLPLRKYGLKFIIQGDFVLPSSREEVDGDSPWNQWLLSQFPYLFVSAERSFCALSCFRENPGKAVTAFMNFVPLVGEVHGFFSTLPRMIISKLRTSKCFLLEGDNSEWVPPCKVLRSWNEQAHTLLPDNLLREHLGLGFLDKNIVLSDSLASALGIEEYGPKILVQIISSLCHTVNGLKSMGLDWLSSWLNTVHTMLPHSFSLSSLNFGMESDLINSLKKIPFIPLSDGTYGSVDDGTIWLHSDASSTGFDNGQGLEAFPKLYAKLRIVSPALFGAAAAVDISCYDSSLADNITRMLHRVGIQLLSAHEIVKAHILPAISDNRITIRDKDLVTEYLSFVMFHLQSSCPNCHVERGYIISELYNKAFILTNHGYKRPFEASIHFNKEFGNPINVNMLIDGMDLEWHEVDVSYLKHPITESLSDGMMKWRKFFQELGITDFVHLVLIERRVTDLSHVVLKNIMCDRDLISPRSIAKDWESQELVHLLSQLSSSGDQIRSKYLLEVLDKLWDDHFCDKVTCYCKFDSTGDSRPFKSSFISSLCDVRWIASSMDDELHYPKDLFYDCDAVHSILGASAPYAVPKVRSEKLLSDIGFKTQVNLDDIMVVLQLWRRSETPFMASIAQMSKLYTFVWNEMATSKQKIVGELHSGPSIFVPLSGVSRHEDVVPGVFLSPQEVYWHDSTGSMDKMMEINPRFGSSVTHCPLTKTLCNIYPGLHDFFVYDCGVDKIPPLRSYLQILQQLSTIALPSQVAKMVFRVFLKWSEGLKSGLLTYEDIVYLKEHLLKLEWTVLPIVQDKWVSLHPSFGLVCWCDDEKLRKEFKHFENIDFLYFGELNDDEEEMFQLKISVLMQTLGIPALSKVVTREAIYYGPADCSLKASLVNWALPYAQRYIHNVHPDKYIQLKQSGAENLSHLQIVVVENLFYRNVVKRSGIASEKRFECSCLLQGDVLYTTRESDSHSIFMEISRLLFDGTPELHLANFLHMITTMAESGSTEEQTEFFILNSQKVPRLPDEELVWSLSSVSSSTENDTFLMNFSSTVINEQNPSKSKRKPGISSNWPPVDWKTAPGFRFARASGLQAQAVVPQPSSRLQLRMKGGSEDTVAQTDPMAKGNADWTMEVDPAATTTACLQDSETSEDPSHQARDLVASAMDLVVDSVDLVTPSDVPNLGSLKSSERDQLSFGTPNIQQTMLTGRLGEHVAFNYFAANFGKTIVKWVNEVNETGLPYDIVIGNEEKTMEYIEVKATKSAKKDWFAISVREWQFAVEKGESYSIARVVLSGNNMARIRIFKNPVRLSQLGKLQLAVLMPKQEKEFSVVS